MALKKSIVFCPVLILFGLSTPAAPYSEYEDEITQILSQRVPEQEIVRLRTPGSEFITLYRKASLIHVRGAAIIIHPLGAHPDWPEVIAPMRTRLPDAGWATLSLQMPILPPGTPLSDYGGTITESSNRLTAAVRYLKEQQFINIIIIGYGFGAAVGAEFLATNPGHKVDAFIGISMQSHDFLNPRLRLLDDLEIIGIPMLDVYAGRDRDKVLRQIDDRRLAGKKNGRRVYDQIMIGGADHFYAGVEKGMIDQVCAWLEKSLLENLINIQVDTDFNNEFISGEINDE